MIKRLVVLYGLFLVALVIWADSGRASWFFTGLGWLPMGDKLGHFFLMGAMSFLLTLASGGNRIHLKRVALLRTPFWLAVVVTLEEISQFWLDTRSFSLIDLSFNYLGIMVWGYLGLKLQAGGVWESR